MLGEPIELIHFQIVHTGERPHGRQGELEMKIDSESRGNSTRRGCLRTRHVTKRHTDLQIMFCIRTNCWDLHLTKISFTNHPTT
jgi:hypothetical protein